MDIEVRIVAPDSNDLDQILLLHRKNTSTLGFMPKKAFEQAAEEHRILVAHDERRVAGYLLFGVNYRFDLVYITHLCVDNDFRSLGVARKLFTHLTGALKDRLRGVRVRCRRDYEANDVWPRLGFSYICDLSGRGKDKSVLTVWWYDFDHPTLFSADQSPDADSGTQVVIDTNILIDLTKPEEECDPSSRALVADWVDIALCVTPEARNEIQRHEDELTRKHTLAWMTRLDTIRTHRETVVEFEGRIRDCFPTELTRQDESDMRHIAHCLSASVPFFVTRDDDYFLQDKNPQRGQY